MARLAPLLCLALALTAATTVAGRRLLQGEARGSLGLGLQFGQPSARFGGMFGGKPTSARQ